ncbi:speedy protein E4-like [Ochotona princeps]|uniref:speedy protein E4-like n=1 Tax=Ochotona princeps TaxID=9978 RepID=UPI0027150E5C|nr:speedy protein E4-like [Ochotona princeps]
MASCEADSQIEDCPLEALVADEVPGPSAPRMDTSSEPQSSACSRKRPWSSAFPNSGSDSEMEAATEMQGPCPQGCRASSPQNSSQRRRQSTEPMKSWAVEWLLGLKMRLKKQHVSTGSDSETEVTLVLQGHLASGLQGELAMEPNPKVLIHKRTSPMESWAVEWLIGSKMRLKKQRVSTVLPEHHKVFNRLLEDPVVKRFLAWDKQLRLSDKYLLAMVVAYLSRAGLFSWQYRRIHFFVALYLANDMEEDDEAPKQAIFSFLYGRNYAQRPFFHKLRLQFMRCMGWKARVTLEECEEIQAYDPELWVWGRDRALLC